MIGEQFAEEVAGHVFLGATTALAEDFDELAEHFFLAEDFGYPVQTPGVAGVAPGPAHGFEEFVKEVRRFCAVAGEEFASFDAGDAVFGAVAVLFCFVSGGIGFGSVRLRLFKLSGAALVICRQGQLLVHLLKDGVLRLAVDAVGEPGEALVQASPEGVAIDDGRRPRDGPEASDVALSDLAVAALVLDDGERQAAGRRAEAYEHRL